MDHLACAKASLAIVIPNLGGFAGAYYTRKAVKGWYQNLNFPPGRPNDRIFAPVWTGLYCGMGYASYLVWKNGGGFSGAKIPLTLYGIQLGLNWAWSPIFFIKKEFGLATAELGATLFVAAATSHHFAVVDRTAGLLMLPYLAWLAYACYLSYGVWKRNPKSAIKAE